MSNIDFTCMQPLLEVKNNYCIVCHICMATADRAVVIFVKKF